MGETTDFPPAKAVMKPVVNWWDIVFFLFNTCYALYSGEGNGTPLQYSCLENPMDGESW